MNTPVRNVVRVVKETRIYVEVGTASETPGKSLENFAPLHRHLTDTLPLEVVEPARLMTVTELALLNKSNTRG